MTILDHIQNWFTKPRQRRFEAAAGGRRLGGAGTMAAPNRAILASGTTLGRRAAYIVANYPWAARGVEVLESNIIGPGIRARSRHPREATRKTLQAAWDRWTRDADADGLTGYHGIQEQAMRSQAVYGEAFILMETDPAARGAPLRLRLIPPDQVDISLNRDIGNGRRIAGGIEYDARNRRQAYHVFEQAPGDPLAVSTKTRRIPAADVIHLFKVTTPGQVRGVSWFAPVLTRIHELDALEDAQLVKQKVAALFAGFIRDLEGGAGGFDGTEASGIMEASLEPGTMKILPPGVDVTFSDPAKVGDGDEFLKSQLRAIAAGLGVTYEALTGDMRETNYSSARVALLEFRRFVETIQRNIIIPQLCRPVWERFVTMAVLSGAIHAPDFERTRDDYFAVDWIPPAQAWVDPQKDAAAAVLEMENNLRSRAEIVAERGRDIEDLDAEILNDPVAPSKTTKQPETATDA